MVDDVFAVIADSTRRNILGALSSGKRAVGELVDELGVSQPTVSKHLKVLRQIGLVKTEALGQKRFYSLTPEPLSEVSQWIETIVKTESMDQEKEATALPAETDAVSFTPLAPFKPDHEEESTVGQQKNTETKEADKAAEKKQSVQLEVLPGLPTAVDEPNQHDSRGIFAALTRWGRRRSR